MKNNNQWWWRWWRWKLHKLEMPSPLLLQCSKDSPDVFGRVLDREFERDCVKSWPPVLKIELKFKDVQSRLHDHEGPSRPVKDEGFTTLHGSWPGSWKASGPSGTSGSATEDKASHGPWEGRERSWRTWLHMAREKLSGSCSMWSSRLVKGREGSWRTPFLYFSTTLL